MRIESTKTLTQILTASFAFAIAMLLGCGEMAPEDEVSEDAAIDQASEDSAYIDVFPRGDLKGGNEGEKSSAPVADQADPRGKEAASNSGSTGNSGDSPAATQPVADSSPSSPDNEAPGQAPGQAPDNPPADPEEDTWVDDPADWHDDEVVADLPKEEYKPSYSRMLVDERSQSQVIQIMPKDQRTDVQISRHPDFVPGAYQIFAKWSNNPNVKGKGRAAVQVNLVDPGQPGARCNYEDTSFGDWRSVGVFYLSENAKVSIHNKNNSAFVVENSLLFVPVRANDVDSPERFRCLDGQIDGHGLRGW